jgi:pyridoxamine 5'-phosphate oxidase
MNYKSIRREYRTNKLSFEELPNNPLELFREWLNEAIQSGFEDATAMALSTIGINGFPQTRIVLLKSVENKGFSFFTNYNRQKGTAIDANNKVALTFYWTQNQRQIRITGNAKKLSKEISDQYFASRPINSQFSAWASNQSEEILSRKKLENNFQNIKEKYKGTNIPRPDYWGGFNVAPLTIEFWQGRKNRLHDRFLYKKYKLSWKITRLAP